ncbi:MAG: methylmalonyl Co-A mutase-associated GTPase MeaB [Chloroflexi bacterium]|nr:methylmalonyl Co-A mutase-associated GTPase MeaB [Chloroflexota bacterium]
MELVEKMLAGEQGALARLITMVEREDPEVADIMKATHPRAGRAYCIGVTGPPGAGKSTVADKLTALIRAKGLTVGIIACDPTSPFSGGAVLGDRIRMQQHYLDSGVFIRSMATRGSMGGLPKVAQRIVKLLDAFGKDVILVETVGVGQTELDIMEAADTVVVVLVPEGGDAVQALKAGLLEIADILVVNKADREGAERFASELVAMLDLSSEKPNWQPPVLLTQAHTNTGIDKLYEAIEKHKKVLQETGQLLDRRRRRRRNELLHTVEEKLKARLEELVEKDGMLGTVVEEVEKGDRDPYSSAMEILKNKALINRWLSAIGEGN